MSCVNPVPALPSPFNVSNKHPQPIPQEALTVPPDSQYYFNIAIESVSFYAYYLGEISPFHDKNPNSENVIGNYESILYRKHASYIRNKFLI